MSSRRSERIYERKVNWLKHQTMYCRMLKLKKMPALLLMVDFEKAFDSVMWTFIKKALDFFNLGPDIK